jgi:hypothetical protein
MFEVAEPGVRMSSEEFAVNSRPASLVVASSLNANQVLFNLARATHSLPAVLVAVAADFDLDIA